MAAPTVDSRIKRRCLVMSDDAAFVAGVQCGLPEGWTLIESTDLARVGGFEEVLQLRFIVLDLDAQAFEPLAVIEEVRGEMMLNVAIFCFGGAPAIRDQARRARADRFFERAQSTEKVALFCEQFGW